jgi:peptidoglycan/xylan/chitin deacetylase (PgdA/CDA1 family)
LASPSLPRILMYHGICKLSRDPNGACTSIERFRAQMNYLKIRNLRGVSVRELLRAESTRGLIGLTFDDGYENFLQAAVPVLEGFGFSATVFVVSGLLGEENDWKHDFEPRPRLKLLPASGVREVAERGMEVGSHGASHVGLRGLDPELLQKEVKVSREALGEALGREVEGFCYPYGSLDDAAIQAVRTAGYGYACAVTKRKGWDAHSLPRIPVSEKDSLHRFATKLSVYLQYAAVKGRLRKHFRGGS